MKNINLFDLKTILKYNISMKESILRTKAINFAASIVNMYEDFLLLKKDNSISGNEQNRRFKFEYQEKL